MRGFSVDTFCMSGIEDRCVEVLFLEGIVFQCVSLVYYICKLELGSFWYKDLLVEASNLFFLLV